MSRIRQSGSSGALLIALVVFAGTPLAAESADWYVDLGLGESAFDGRFGERNDNAFDDDSESSSFAVGYSIHRHLAIEAGYVDFGSFSGEGRPCPRIAAACAEALALQLCVEGGDCSIVAVPLEAEVTGVSLALVPSWPVGDSSSVYGKIGLLDWQADLSAPDRTFGIGTFDRFSEADLLTALGLRWRLGEHWGARVEHLRLDADLGSTTVGVSWRF